MDLSGINIVIPPNRWFGLDAVDLSGSNTTINQLRHAINSNAKFIGFFRGLTFPPRYTLQYKEKKIFKLTNTLGEIGVVPEAGDTWAKITLNLLNGGKRRLRRKRKRRTRTKRTKRTRTKRTRTKRTKRKNWGY